MFRFVRHYVNRSQAKIPEMKLTCWLINARFYFLKTVLCKLNSIDDVSQKSLNLLVFSFFCIWISLQFLEGTETYLYVPVNRGDSLSVFLAFQRQGNFCNLIYLYLQCSQQNHKNCFGLSSINRTLIHSGISSIFPLMDFRISLILLHFRSSS